MTVGEKIQQLRNAAGISQEQLAEQLGVSRESVSKWELNYSVPDISKIVKLSELFSVSTDKLLKDSVPQSNSMNIQTQSLYGNERQTTLEQIVMLNLANNKQTMGIKVVILGFIMIVLELAFLPIYGVLQKSQGDGFYSDFMEYAHTQPMSIIFSLTVIIIFIGCCLFINGYLYKVRNRTK